MKFKKKQKLKKILSFIGCFALAFLLCALPFVKSTNSASAYQPPAPGTKYRPGLGSIRPPKFVDDDYLELYSEFIAITDTFRNATYYNKDNLPFNDTDYNGSSSFIFNADINYSNLSQNLTDTIISPSENFDYSSFLKSYLLYYYDMTFVDSTYSIYLDFCLFARASQINNSNYSGSSYYPWSSASFVITNKSTNENVLTLNFADYKDTNIIIQQSPNFLLFSLNLNYLVDTLSIDNIVVLFSDYLITLNYTTTSFDVSNDYLFSTLPSFGLSIARFDSFAFSPRWSTSSSAKPVIFSNNNNLNYFYYLNYTSSGVDYNTYWNEYYNQFYLNKIDSSYTNGYDLGYAQGLINGAETDEVVSKAILSFVSYPFTILSGFLNFNILGFNIYNILLGFITTLLLIWVIKKLN